MSHPERVARSDHQATDQQILAELGNTNFAVAFVVFRLHWLCSLPMTPETPEIIHGDL